jgi:hypothetical protein
VVVGAWGKELLSNAVGVHADAAAWDLVVRIASAKWRFPGGRVSGTLTLFREWSEIRFSKRTPYSVGTGEEGS